MAADLPAPVRLKEWQQSKTWGYAIGAIALAVALVTLSLGVLSWMTGGQGGPLMMMLGVIGLVVATALLMLANHYGIKAAALEHEMQAGTAK